MIKRFIRAFLGMIERKEIQLIQRDGKFIFTYDGKEYEAGYVESE